jgi:HSP20 family molecular chaperone IbpA
MNTELAKQQNSNEPAVERTRNGMTFSPRIDICEKEDELLLFADMPGVTADGLDIRFENHELTIHGRVAPRHKDVEYLYAEYGTGDFFRTFSIGESVDASRISGELRNGVLTLHLPKTEEVKPRRIEVRAS